MFAMMKKNGRLAEALKQSNSQDAVGGGKERSLYEQGRAAYAERKWDDAARHFQQLSKEFPQNAEAPSELRRSLSRLTESRTGKYSFERMMADEQAGSQDIDVADYAGPIELADIPGKGKGIIATEDIKRGTLIFVEKPFATTELSQKSRLVKPLSHLTPTEVAERMFLYDHGQILGGFVNHSCLANSASAAFGDVKVEFAVADIKKGEEVTRPYVDPMKPLSERWLWFECDCRLCELDRADPRRDEREELLKSVLEDLPRIRSHPKFVAKAEDLLKKMRKTYTDRTELQALLYWPLEALGDHYKSVGNSSKAIKYYEEAIEIAFCYKALHDADMARKYGQMAADLERLTQGHCSFPDLLNLL
ncbi:TPR domain protein [Aphelenchoides avenae]|nr:TPR domain protein [Aphelenchus avenae]